jgi:hypothetical protein
MDYQRISGYHVPNQNLMDGVLATFFGIMASVSKNLEVNVKEMGCCGIQSVNLVIIQLVVVFAPLIVLKAIMMMVHFVENIHMSVTVNLVWDAQMDMKSMMAYVILNVLMDIMAEGQYAGEHVLVKCLMIAILKFAQQLQQRVYLYLILLLFLFVNMRAR